MGRIFAVGLKLENGDGTLFRVDQPVMLKAALREDFLFRDLVETFGALRKNFNAQVRSAFDPLFSHLVQPRVRNKNDIRLIDVDLVEENIERCDENFAEALILDKIVED